MPIYSLNDVTPRLPASGAFFVAPGARVIGNVLLEEDASVWFNAVLRGDNELIHIGARSNVQDNCVLHTDPGCPLTIGSDCTIGHSVILHGCLIGDGALIGMGSTLLNRARIGANSLVGANALITEGKDFPPNSMIMGAPARVVRTLDEREILALRMSAASYVARVSQFRDGARRIG